MPERSPSLMPKAPTRKDQPIVPMDLVFGAILWFGLVALITWAFVPPHGGNWTDTAKAIAAATGIATGIFAPISAIVMAKYQSQLTNNLEGLRKDYTREIEELKSSLSAGVEVKKALIAGRIRAFDTMLTAAHFFHFVLRQMAFAENTESENMLREANRRAAEASSVVWHLSEEDRGKWYSVYQRSFYLAGLLRRASPEERREIFTSNAGELGDAIRQLERAGLAAFEEADKG
jgi:hypothetical protein